MALPRDSNFYGGPWQDKGAVRDPSRDISAAQFNRIVEDLAQLTRTSHKGWWRFQTQAGTGTFGIVDQGTQWGSSAAYRPSTTNRSGTGVYIMTFPASFNDGMVPPVSETLAFKAGWANIASATQSGTARVVASGNIVTIYVRNDAGSLSDLAAATEIDVFVR